MPSPAHPTAALELRNAAERARRDAANRTNEARVHEAQAAEYRDAAAVAAFRAAELDTAAAALEQIGQDA